ncbi:hypothetical protein ACFL6S_21900, partial [Candidatus Poribacteria bacterium]
MSKGPDMSVRVRCHGCKKIFVVNLVKEQDMPDDKKVEMVRPCPYCGEENVFEVAGNVVKADALYRTARGVIEGK